MPSIIQINRTEVALRFTPFPQTGSGAQAQMEGRYNWSAIERSDVPSQRTAIPDLVEAGHPAAAAVLNLQSAASAYLTNRFAARGEDLTTSPVSKLNLWFSYSNPFPTGSAVVLNWKATWSPVQYPTITSTEQGSVSIPTGSALFADLQAIASSSLANAVDRYPTHTIQEPTGSEV